VKMELARSIVRDFHGPEAALQAQLDFDREVRQGDVPEDIQEVEIAEDARSVQGIRVVKLLLGIGIVDSRSDAERKIKAGAVEINGERCTNLLLTNFVSPLTVRVGKQWKRVRVPE
ncbi:MAG TPA: S4 domain-containing protein, partial [Bryobacteraceae bacterium]|nr:S4 domain-containing protein [Bryobacteraceae bacterium]